MEFSIFGGEDLEVPSCWGSGVVGRCNDGMVSETTGKAFQQPFGFLGKSLKHEYIYIVYIYMFTVYIYTPAKYVY